MKKYDFAVIGGDMRTACMASSLLQRGYDIISYGTLETSVDDKISHAPSLKEALVKAPNIICGIPFEKTGNLYFEKALPSTPITELQRQLRKHHRVFGGVIPTEFKAICEKRKISCFDFMEEEPLTIYNAVATAEGAILEALSHKPTQLHQSETLVLGYGKCGKILADKLKGLSANVTVSSNHATELATAAALGFHTLPLSKLSQQIGGYEYIFNTIPATILTRDYLEETDSDSLIVDIASNRIGADYDAAALLNRKVLFCPGLPGKYASQSCAEHLTEYVLNKLL